MAYNLWIKKLVVIGLIIIAIGLALIIFSDSWSYETQLNVNFNEEWEGYYELTLNNQSTREDIEGNSPLNFTVKRENGDQLLVNIKAKNNGSTNNMSIELLKENEVITKNSTNNPYSGVKLFAWNFFI